VGGGRLQPNGGLQRRREERHDTGLQQDQAVPTVIVISTAVPKVATVLIKPSSARFATKPKRNASSPGPDGAGALEPVSPT